MAFVSIPNGVRVVHQGIANGIPIINTIGCQNGAGGETGSSLDSIATSHGAAWRTNVLPLLIAGYTHQATFAYSLEDETAPVGQATLTGSAVGGDNEQAAPASLCYVVSFQTAKRGRTYQGRTFVGPLGYSVQGTGLAFKAVNVTAMQNAMNAYKNAVDPTVGDNGRLAVCSKGSILKGIAPHVEPVTQVIVRSAYGSQRRRLT